MHPLLQKQRALHAEGTLLLQTILLPLLSKYGTTTVGGSYSYQLLYHPDIDIDVVSEQVSKELFVELCHELLQLDQVSKIKAADRVAFRHTHIGIRPTGFWISPTIHFGDSIWTVDIWLQKPEWHTGKTNRFAAELATLDEITRIKILTLKQELIAQSIYGVGNEFESVDVYEGVLHGFVTTVAELRQYKAPQNTTL